ncbi:MAG: Ig domain-containing protein, partial [Vicinamibacterales bacterium]
GLPAGLALDTAGVLSGTPSAAGSSSFTVGATDANACSGTLAYTIVTAAAPPPPPVCGTITLTPTTLPGATVGVAFNQVFTGNDGVSPYAFGVTTGGVPAGLALTAAGVLSGTPTTAGSSSFTVGATDANACSGTLAYTIVTAAAPVPPAVCPTITLVPATLPGAPLGQAFNQTITAGGGGAPYSFGLATGALPSGLTLTAAGALAGTPDTAGAFPFTVRATDSAGCSNTHAYSIDIFLLPAVPALPLVAAILLTCLLTVIGLASLRRQGREGSVPR